MTSSLAFESPAGGWGVHTSIERVRDAVISRGLHPKGPTLDFMCQCPAHDDSTASLHITWDPNGGAGRTLMYCHGCQASTEQLCEALGLIQPDLFDNPPAEKASRSSRSHSRRATNKRKGPLPKKLTTTKRTKATDEWVEKARYPYVTADGEIIQEVIRKERGEGPSHEKTFVQIFHLPNGTTVARKPKGFTPVLYNLPTVTQAVADHQPIWLLEGEKDCQTAEDLGLVATTNSGGAKALTDDLLAPLYGADVHVVVDLDKPGWTRAAKLNDLLAGHCTLTIHRPAVDGKGADFTDHINAGNTLDNLVTVTVAEVSSYLALATIVDLYSRGISACDEVAAHLNLTGSKDKDNHEESAKRWLLEIESALLSFTDQLDLLRDLAFADNASRIVTDNYDQAQHLNTLLADRGRTAFDSLSEPRPPVLRRRTPPKTPDELAHALDPFSNVRRFDPKTASLHNRTVYELVDGEIVSRRVTVKHTEDGVGYLQMSDGTVVISAKIVIEHIIFDENSSNADHPSLAPVRAGAAVPELPTISAYQIAWRSDDGTIRRASIPAEDMHKGGWVHNLAIADSGFDSRTSGLAKIFDALRYISQPIHATRFIGTGWRQLEDLSWVYSHAGGLITAHGHKDSPTGWENALDNYDFAAPYETADDLRKAFYTSSAGAFMNNLPVRVAAPLIGTAFKAPIDRNPYTTLLVGSPGTYKTSLAALTMHHFGISWDRARPGVSLTKDGSTQNALRALLNRSRDTLFFLDDLNPGGDISGALKRLGDVLHLIFNQTVRDRMSHDAKLRDGEKPFASAIATSELLPSAGSSEERSFALPLRRNEVDLHKLIALDAPEHRLARNRLMATYLQWVAEDYPRHEARIRESVALAAATYRDNHHMAPRDAEPLAHMWAGWEHLLFFLVERGALTPHERDQWRASLSGALLEAASQAHDADTPTTTAGKVMDLLHTALRAGHAHITDVRTGDQPDDKGLALRLGWRKSQYTQALNPADTPLEPKGLRLGYINLNTTRELLIECNGLEAAIKSVSATLTDGLSIDRATASRALADIDVLKTQVQHGKRRYTLARSVQCETGLNGSSAKRRFYVLDLDAFFHEDDDSAPETRLQSPPPPNPGNLGLPSPLKVETPIELYPSAPAQSIQATELADTADQSSIDTANATSQPEPTPELAPESMAEETHEQDDLSAAAGPLDHAHATDGFSYPCAAVTTSEILLPDGKRLPLTRPITSYGDLAHICYALNLGTQVSKSREEGGIIIVTDELALSLGIPVDDLPTNTQGLFTEFARRMKKWESTPHPALAKALEDGWMIGSAADSVPQLRGMTRLYRAGRRGAQIQLQALMFSDVLLDRTVDPMTLTQVVGKFADLFGQPWHVSASTTGFDIIEATRRDRKELFTPTTKIPAPAELKWIDPDLAWTRVPTTEEAAMTYLHVYDRGGAYMAGVTSCELPVGDPTHHAHGTAFDKKLPGYWLITNPNFANPEDDDWAGSDWRYPSPLFTAGNRQRIWVTTPTLELATSLDFKPEILEAWTWEQHGRILDLWAKKIREARTLLLNDPSTEARMTLALTKEMYTKTIGMMGSEEHKKGTRVYAPHRRQHIVAKARANLLRRIIQIGRDTGCWPLAVLSDSIAYASNEPDPVKAFPGDPKNYGRAIGQLRAEYTGLLSDHLRYLDGTPWKPAAKSTLTKVES